MKNTGEKQEDLLVELRKQHKQKRREIVEIVDQINELETFIRVPELREKYEGKFFTHKNGFGGDVIEEWDVYVHCVKVEDDGKVVCNTFQEQIIDGDGKIVFDLKTYGHDFMLGTEITKEKYEEEMFCMLEKVNGMLKEHL